MLSTYQAKGEVEVSLRLMKITFEELDGVVHPIAYHDGTFNCL